MRKAKKLLIMLFWKRTFTPNVCLCMFWHFIPGSVFALQWSIDESLELDEAKIVLAAIRSQSGRLAVPPRNVMHCGPPATDDAQNCVRLDRKNVRCDAASALRNREKSRWPFCTVRYLGRMILIPSARRGETQPPLPFATQVNSPGNPRNEIRGETL
jgi:hypothetical protein